MTGEPCRPDELRTLVAAILAAAWRVTSAVTSAPREQAGAAGRIIEPLVCEPIASGTMPAATAAAEPEDEPPGVRVTSRGLRVLPG